MNARSITLRHIDENDMVRLLVEHEGRVRLIYDHRRMGATVQLPWWHQVGTIPEEFIRSQLQQLDRTLEFSCDTFSVWGAQDDTARRSAVAVPCTLVLLHMLKKNSSVYKNNKYAWEVARANLAHVPHAHLVRFEMCLPLVGKQIVSVLRDNLTHVPHTRAIWRHSEKYGKHKRQTNIYPIRREPKNSKIPFSS